MQAHNACNTSISTWAGANCNAFWSLISCFIEIKWDFHVAPLYKESAFYLHSDTHLKMQRGPQQTKQITTGVAS